MLRLSLTVSLAIAINLMGLLMPEPTEVSHLGDALTQTANLEARWGLTRIQHGEAGTTEEHYRSWLPEETRWNLVWVDGEAPSETTLAAYQSSPQTPIDLNLLAEKTADHPTILEENDLYRVYHVYLEETEAAELGGTSPLFGTISVRKTSGLVELIVLRDAEKEEPQGQG